MAQAWLVRMQDCYVVEAANREEAADTVRQLREACIRSDWEQWGAIRPATAGEIRLAERLAVARSVAE